MPAEEQSVSPAQARSERRFVAFLFAAVAVIAAVRAAIVFVPPLFSPAERAGELVQPGRDYYFMVMSLELAQLAQPAPPAAGEEAAAPRSVYFQLLQGGAQVYESATREGPAPKWGPDDIDLRELVFTGPKVDLERIVQAPRITPARGEDLILRVFEVGENADRKLADLAIPTSELHVGDMMHFFTGGPVTSAVIRVASVQHEEDMLR